MVDYESSSLLEHYLLLHYGTEKEVLPYDFAPKNSLHFPQRCVKWCERFLIQRQRALDLGCAVGGASFELAKIFSEVIGVDYSQQFIAVANELKCIGEVPYSFVIEGDIKQLTMARVDLEINRQRVSFQRGDACQLNQNLGTFDLVLMVNLVDRLMEPSKCLKIIVDFVNPSGLLMIASPYTWLEPITPKKNWLGGYLEKEKAVFTFDALVELLSDSFNLIQRDNLPFLIREHARKFQWSVSEATLWRKK